jgi:hypothetical protein
MLSTGRRRPNYALLQKVTIYSRLPEFAARRLKPVEFVLAKKRHDFKYKPPAKPLPNGPGLGIHPCNTTPNLTSPPGLRVEDRPIFTTLRLCVAFW